MRANSAVPLVSRSRLVSLSLFYNFVVASGAMRLLINLMIHSGNALTATMTATFHPKRTETTNDRSARELSSVQGSGEGRERTKIFGQKDHAEGVYAERDDFGDDHVNMPFSQERPLLNKDSVGEGTGCLPDRDLQCDHDELIEDQRRERNGNDVQKLVLEQNEGYDHDRGT